MPAAGMSAMHPVAEDSALPETSGGTTYGLRWQESSVRLIALLMTLILIVGLAYLIRAQVTSSTVNSVEWVAHTHEVEEVFFVLQGHLDVFVQDEEGHKITKRLGPWECIACPAGVIHGYDNNSLEPVYFQVMLGRGRPETMGYADDKLYARRDDHLKAVT